MSEDQLFDIAFAMSKEFGWTPHYILTQMPIRWFNMYSRRLEDYYIQKKAAYDGKRAVPSRETTADRKAEKKRRLKECRARISSSKQMT